MIEPYFPAVAQRPAHTPRNRRLSDKMVWLTVSAGWGEHQTAHRAHRTRLELAAHNTLEAQNSNLAVDDAAAAAAADLTSGGRQGNWMPVAD